MLVLDAIDLQRKLQLARDLLAILDGHELLNYGLGRISGRLHPGQVDGDAQQTTSGAFDLHQVIPQARHNLFNDLLQCHVFSSIPEKQKTR